MAELVKIETAPGLVFDALVDGPAGAPLVLLLHDFAESFHMWRSQLLALAAAGYRAVAPSQRGYSPGARPDPTDLAQYHTDRLVADAMGIAAACGYVSIADFTSWVTTRVPASPGSSRIGIRTVSFLYACCRAHTPMHSIEPC